MAIVAGLLVPATPAAAAPPVMLQTSRKTVRIDGVDYRVRFAATNGGTNAFVSVEIAQTVDPDGRGILRATKAVGLMFGGTGLQRVADNLSSASLKTGDKLAPVGEIRYTFEATHPVERQCGARTRVGRLRGTLRLKTGTSLGLLSLDNMRARLTEGDGCFGDATAGSCPPPMRDLFGFAPTGGFMLGGIRRDRAKAADIMMGTSRTLSLDNPDFFGMTSHLVTARVPLDHVHLADDLSRGTIRGHSELPVRGKAVFTAKAALEEEVAACGTDRESVMRFRDGRAEGTLRGWSVAGKKVVMRDKPMPMFASRLFSRAK